MNDNKQKVEETLGQAALRLLQRLERKKAVPAYSGTRIQQSPKEGPSSLGEEEAAERSAHGGMAHHSRQPVTAYPAGGVTGGGLVFANDNRAVGVMASEAGVSVTMHPTATSADLYRHDFTERESFRNRYARWGEW